MTDSYSQVIFKEINSIDNETTGGYTTRYQLMKVYPEDKFEDDFLENVNNSQFRIFIPAFSFICLLLLFGIPGNILAIVVYATQLKKGVARYFILTLAVSDLITCSCIAPTELWLMKHFWTFDNQFLCKTFRFVAYAVNNISSLTLLAIAFERYRIICSPWKQKFTTKCSKIVCVLVTLAAIITSVPMIFIYGTYTVPLFKYTDFEKDISSNNSMEEKNTTSFIFGRTCMVDDNIVGSVFPLYINAIYIAATLIIFCVLIYLYGCIAKQLIIQRIQNKNKQNKESQKRSCKRLKHVTVMVLILTFVYELCYLPCLTVVCIRLINPLLYRSINDSEKMAYQFFLKSYLINSALNPCIYCYCNREFRLGALKVLRKFKIVCLRDQTRTPSGSYLSS